MDADIGERSELLFRLLDWLPLKEELNLKRSSLIFRRIKDENTCPSYITELLTRNSDRHTEPVAMESITYCAHSIIEKRKGGEISKPLEQNCGTASL